MCSIGLICNRCTSFVDDNIAPNPKCQRVIVLSKPRLFVPKTFRSQEQKVPMRNVRSRDLRSRELLFPGLFVPLNIRHQQRLFMRPFVLRLLHVFVVLLLVFGRPFIKRFALCYRTVVCLSCPVRNVGVL